LAKARGLISFDYVLEDERAAPPGEQTIWKLKALTYAEKEQLGDLCFVSGTEGMSLLQNPLRKARKILNLGLLGWERFLGEDGQPLAFRAAGEGFERRIPDEVLNAIAEYAIELANAITEGATLQESTAKNS